MACGVIFSSVAAEETVIEDHSAGSQRRMSTCETSAETSETRLFSNQAPTLSISSTASTISESTGIDRAAPPSGRA